MDLGTTDTGKVWCMKALHPADPIVPFAGIPDEDAVPVVFQNYQQTVTCLNPTPSLAGNWNLEVFFYPHPYLIGSIHTTDAAGVHAWSPILNNQIAGGDLAAKAQTFLQTVERYRIGYMGITGYHDAAALSNNGLLSAAQFMATPGYNSLVAGTQTAGALNYMIRLGETWADAPRTFEQLSNMPNAYFGAAKDGVYVPYKLSETCQDWQNGSDRVCVLNQEDSSLCGVAPWSVLPATPSAPGYPYGLPGVYCTGGLHLIHKRADSGMVHISLRQLAASASYTFYFRAGWEYQVQPGTQFVMFTKTSPAYDPAALAAYFSIAREMKDAYPASYNDLGSIIATIGSIASRVLPMLSGFFGNKKPVSQRPVVVARQRVVEDGTSVARPRPNLKSATEIERDTQRVAHASVPRGVQPPPQPKGQQRKPKRR